LFKQLYSIDFQLVEVFALKYFMKNEIYSTCMILYIEPVAHILSLTIDRQRFIVADVMDKKRDQLLGELKGSVIVGAIGDHDG